MDVPLHLFDTPPAYLRGVAPASGYHFPGDAMFRGEPRPFGALLTYSVGGGAAGASAEIEILDSTGAVIRRMPGPAGSGLNRVSWDLREDPPDLGVANAMERGARLQGIEVLPGPYTVRVKLAGGEAEAPLEVRPDPRVEIFMADRVRKQEAVRLGMDLLVAGERVRERSREIAEAVERVLSRVASRDDQEAAELRDSARGIREGLATVEGLLDLMDRDRQEVLAMSATREAPTEAERIALGRMEGALETAIIGINGLMVTRLADLRARAEAAGVGPVPEIRVVIRGGRG